MATIHISDPKDRPYGELSIAAYTPMVINGESYKTVMNYAYSSMLRQSGAKAVVKNASTADLFKLFSEYLDQEAKNVQSHAVGPAYKAKFSSGPMKGELDTLLLETGTRKILYYSQSNNTLGINPITNAGQNIVGLALMGIRHELHMRARDRQRSVDQDQLEEDIYRSYLIYYGALRRMRSGDSLSDYQDLSNSDLFNRIGRDLMDKDGIRGSSPEEVLVSIAPSRESVIRMYKNDNLPSIVIDGIHHQGYMIKGIRAEKLRGLRCRLLGEQRRAIFECVAEFVMQNDYEGISPSDFREAIQQAETEADNTEINSLIGMAIECYFKGELPEIEECMTERTRHIYIPTPQEVSEAEKVDMSIPALAVASSATWEEDTSVNQDPIQLWNDHDPRMDPKFAVLLPASETGEIIIGNRAFASVSAFIVYRTMMFYSDVNSVSDTEKLYQHYFRQGEDRSLVPLAEIINRFNDFKDHHYSRRLSDYAKYAIDKSYNQSRSKQDLLLSTGNKEMVFVVHCGQNQPCDKILGASYTRSHKQLILTGANVVGKHLADVRDRLRAERATLAPTSITSDDIGQLIREQPFINSWLTMKLSDYCRTIQKIWKYHSGRVLSRETDGVRPREDRITLALAKAAIDNVYVKCDHLRALESLVPGDPPKYFKAVLHSIKGFCQSTGDGGECPHGILVFLWQRISVMLYFIVQQLREATDSTVISVISVIATAEMLNTEGIDTDTCPRLADDDYDSCIASALLNILSGIANLNLKHAKNIDPYIGREAVNVAISIILDSKDIQANYFGKAASKKVKTRTSTQYTSTRPAGGLKRPTTKSLRIRTGATATPDDPVERISEHEPGEVDEDDHDRTMSEELDAAFAAMSDDDDSEADVFDDESDEDSLDGSMEMSPRRNQIIDHIRTVFPTGSIQGWEGSGGSLPRTSEVDDLLELISSAVGIIRKAKGITARTKRNRVMFFASNRNL